jgi:hypothetical protein
VSFLIDGCPGAALSFILGSAAFLVAFLDVLGHALLLVGITGFVSAGHKTSISCFSLNREKQPSFQETGGARQGSNALVSSGSGTRLCVLSFRKKRTAMEIVFFAGAFILLMALIYGTLNWHFRSRSANRAGEDIVHDRYRSDQT